MPKGSLKFGPAVEPAIANIYISAAKRFVLLYILYVLVFELIFFSIFQNIFYSQLNKILHHALQTGVYESYFIKL